MTWKSVDLKILRSQIDSFALRNRLYHRPRVILEKLESEGVRREIVLAGLGEWETLLGDRAREMRATAEHFSTHPEVYGDSTPEMIERFTRLAHREDRALKKAGRLRAAVEAEPELPESVRKYVPTWLETDAKFDDGNPWNRFGG